ncbi:MAG: NIPSNAP family protein [Gemmataceae bacterium]|nr:NIPSNAP family protein [Gemmataceae bacterium]
MHRSVGLTAAGVLLMAAMFASAPRGEATAPAADTRLYELRVYYAAPGKLEALHARFRNHTLKLFEKHGLSNGGYFVPAGDNPQRKLVYWITAPSKAARDKSFADFLQDPQWKAVVAETEKDGKLVERIESTFLQLTDYSPPVKLERADPPRVFELRTYTATPGNLGALNERFRNHTLKLFTRHGITNIAYWNLLPDQPKADRMLIYLLAHKSIEAARKSFEAFRNDPDWIAARKASEEKAGGSLTEPKGGVVSEFLLPTDYSPLR